MRDLSSEDSGSELCGIACWFIPHHPIRSHPMPPHPIPSHPIPKVHLNAKASVLIACAVHTELMRCGSLECEAGTWPSFVQAGSQLHPAVTGSQRHPAADSPDFSVNASVRVGCMGPKPIPQHQLQTSASRGCRTTEAVSPRLVLPVSHPPHLPHTSAPTPSPPRTTSLHHAP
jgi:hypothetical protein